MAITESARSSTRRPGPPAAPAWLEVGAAALDTRCDRVGVVMSIGLRLGSAQLAGEDRIWLRPEGGGREWEALVEDLAPGGAL